MALSAFLNVNGYDFPCPLHGFQYTISTTVNAGRNANNAVIGQKVGRDLIKLDSMQWAGLDPGDMAGDVAGRRRFLCSCYI